MEPGAPTSEREEEEEEGLPFERLKGHISTVIYLGRELGRGRDVELWGKGSFYVHFMFIFC